MRMKHPQTTATELQARAETIRRHAPGIRDPTAAGETVRYRCDACCCCGTLWTGPVPLPTQWARCHHVINPGFGGRRCPGTLIPINAHRGAD